MKKLLYCAAVLALGFFAGSCQRENLEPVANGGVTYTITLPEAVQTKGESGYGKYDLYYEVYKTVDAEALATAPLLFENNKVPMEGNTATVTLDLLNDQDYTVLFWANKKDVDYFDLGDLRKVTVKTAVSNNNDRDAFCGKDQIAHHDGTKSKTVTLKRPFAQLNIATIVTTTAGYDVTPVNSKVTVYGAPVTYNVFDGAVSGETTIEYDWNTVPAGKKVNDTYDLVAMNYVLVPEGTVDVEYWIETVNGTVNNTVNNVPVKVNYRTNIIGNLLTSDATYTVEIKPGFDTPAEDVELWDGVEMNEPQVSEENANIYEIVEPSEIAWLAAAVNGTLPENTRAANDAQDFAGKTFVLTSNIDLGGHEWTPIGLGNKHFKGTFDGAGHTISNFKITKRNADQAAFFGTISGNPTIKNLTLQDVKVVYPGEGDSYGAALVGTAYGHVKIENVTVKDSYISGNNKVAGILAHDGSSNSISIDNCHVENCVIESLNQADGGNVGGLLGLFQTDGDQNFIKNSSVKNTVINGINSSNTGKRSNGQFVACVLAKENQVLNIENCVLSGNTFTQNEGVTYVSPYGPFVGGDRESTGTAVVNVKNCSYDATVANMDELNAAVASAAGTLTIKFANDINGTTTIRQKVGANIVIDGCDKKFDGTFYLEGGMQGGDSPETLTFKNINFVHTSGAIDFISANDGQNIGKRYAHNVTVEDCTFTGTPGTEVMAMRYRQTYNMTVKNVTATGVYGLIWATGGDGLVVDNVTTTGKNGISLGTNNNVTIKDIKVVANGDYGYAVRANGEGAYNVNISGSDLKADVPVLIRNTTGAFNLTLSNNTLTTTKDYQLIVANNDYEAGKELEEPTGKYTISGAEGYVVYPVVVAKIGEKTYTSLKAAVAAVQEGETIKVVAEVEEGSIKLPASLKNVTFKGEEGNVLKNMTITAADGNTVNYDGLTFEGLVFDNSNVVLTGWRTNGVVYKNITVNKCEFRNVNRTNNEAAFHINCGATEPVNGFTFTNNVINGVAGGSNSGVYAQLTGDVIFTGNVINNVAFRPYVIQITTDDEIADTFTVTGNTFSGSSKGRAQGLGNNAEGTDQVKLVVSENIFNGITEAQQICYWNFNAECTTADLSKNYYDIDIANDPSRIYYNKAAADVEELVAMGVYPIYTELNADGTINTDSLYTPAL